MRKKSVIIAAVIMLALTGCSGSKNEVETTTETTNVTTEAAEDDGLYGNMTMVDDEGNVRMDVYDLKSVEAKVDPNAGYIVSIVFTDEGSKKFADVTTELIGKQLSIVVDGKVISNPTIQAAIVDGEAQITGLNSFEEAQNIVTKIKGDKNHPAKFDYATTSIDTEPESTETEATESRTEATTEQAVEHREDAIGISEKNISDIDGTFSRNDVRNDVTNSWKVSTIAEDVSMEDYAFSYYNRYHPQENVVEAVINFTRNTSTCMVLQGDYIDICIYDYVDGEEYDAKQMFTGTLLKEYKVYIDNGDIIEVQ